jgi:exodeoxyribonuclease VII small subunit
VSKKTIGLDFEKSLEELEALVEKMETGGMTLEESLKCFERGITLSKACQKSLSQAEQKISILLEKDGKQTLTPFDLSDPNHNDEPGTS